jgi:hypothetical protein
MPGSYLTACDPRFGRGNELKWFSEIVRNMIYKNIKYADMHIVLGEAERLYSEMFCSAFVALV